MAEYYGIGGKRRGSVGNETYSISKGMNVVKSKIIKTTNRKTIKQVIQRVKMRAAMKMAKIIGPDFLEGCFENKRRRESYINTFVRLNTKNACVINKSDSYNDTIIPVGNWQLTSGSLLGQLNPEIIALQSSERATGIVVPKGDLIADGNDTVGNVSKQLMAKYPELKEGMVINFIAILSPSVFQNNVADPITGYEEENVNIVKNNFILNKSNTEKISTKGFDLRKDLQSNPKYYLVGNDYANAKTGSHLWLQGWFAAQKVGNKTYVQSSRLVEGCVDWSSLVGLLTDDLKNNQVNLNTYEHEQEVNIVDDNAF